MPEPEPWSLKWLVGAVATALTQAAHAADQQTAELAPAYEKDKYLSSLSVPAFTIANAQLTIRFVFAGRNPEDSHDVLVRADAESLSGAGSEKLSELTFTLTGKPMHPVPSQ